MLRLSDNKGVVLVIVIMISMIMMIYAVSLVTQQMNQSKASQERIDNIIEEQAVMGEFWNQYSDGAISPGEHDVGIIDGKNCSVIVEATGTPNQFKFTPSCN